MLQNTTAQGIRMKRSFYRLYTLAILSFFLIGSLPLKSIPGTTNTGRPSDINLSDEELAKAMQEMENYAQGIEAFVKSLPPEEQAEFHRVAKQVEEKMQNTDPETLERFLTNTMTEDELEGFLGDVFKEVTPAQTGDESVEKVTIEEPKQKKEVKKKADKKEQTKEEIAVQLINTVINKIDSCLVKIQALPDLSLKIKRWGKQGVIYDYPKDGTWDMVKKEIESMRQDISKLLDKDPEEHTYKYLEKFIEEKNTYDKISKMKTTLEEYEPKIKTESVGIEKITKETKTAVKRTVSCFTEGLYRLELPKDLKKIFDAYESRAKELREKEDGAKKKPKQSPKSPDFQPKQ